MCTTTANKRNKIKNSTKTNRRELIEREKYVHCTCILVYPFTVNLHWPSDARKSVMEWHMPRGSFTVESQSIGMGNVRIVQKLYLPVTMPRSSAYTDKSARRVYFRRQAYSKSNTWSHIWHWTTGPIFDFEKLLWPRNGGLCHSRSLKITHFDRSHASVCWRFIVAMPLVIVRHEKSLNRVSPVQLWSEKAV